MCSGVSSVAQKNLNDMAGEELDGGRCHCNRDGGFSFERALGSRLQVRWVNMVLNLCVSTNEDTGDVYEIIGAKWVRDSQ